MKPSAAPPSHPLSSPRAFASSRVLVDACLAACSRRSHVVSYRRARKYEPPPPRQSALEALLRCLREGSARALSDQPVKKPERNVGHISFKTRPTPSNATEENTRTCHRGKSFPPPQDVGAPSQPPKFLKKEKINKKKVSSTTSLNDKR